MFVLRVGISRYGRIGKWFSPQYSVFGVPITLSQLLLLINKGTVIKS